MKRPTPSLLVWTPRVLGLLFILLLFLFSLDTLGGEAGFWRTLGGFLIHNLPVMILLAALILAWRREGVGAAAFLGFGLWYLIFVSGADLLVYAFMAGIPLLTGLLFLAGWAGKKTNPGEEKDG